MEFDGKALLNAAFLAKASKEGDKQICSLLKIFDKYGLSFVDGIAMILELSAIMQDGESNADM